MRLIRCDLLQTNEFVQIISFVYRITINLQVILNTVQIKYLQLSDDYIKQIFKMPVVRLT